MKIAIFGLTISSSWGNGHATLWRGLCRALAAIRRLLGAVRVAPLYGHVDPQVHLPVAPVERYRADLSYLGTYAADRLATMEALFVAPAHRRPDRRFLIGGAQYPQDFPWS